MMAAASAGRSAARSAVLNTARPSSRAPSSASARGISPKTVVAQGPQADSAVLAMQLIGRWQRVSAGHLSLAAGCACSYGAAINVSDFDELILDFLRNRFAADVEIAGFIDAASTMPAQTSAAPTTTSPRTASLRALLRAIATGTPILSTTSGAALLAAIDTSVISIEEQHR